MKSSASRYKQRKPKKEKKISFEKKVLLQSIVSAFLLIYCIIISNTNSAVVQKEFINSSVNITSTKSDIQKMLSHTLKTAKSAIASGGKYLNMLVDFCNNGFGSTDTEANIASAEPAIYPETPEELKKKEEPKEEEIKKEEPPTFRWPLKGEVTSAFGERTHPLSNNSSIHYGIDIAGSHGDCVISSLPGTVEDTGFDSNLGNYVKVRHNENMQTVYGHLSEILVRKDEVVDGNTRIGSVGSTGAATGPHVHLEVRIDGVSVDPAEYLPKQ